MAIVEVKIPQLSESITEATLLDWKKQVGEYVEADEILIEVETDKVVMEVPAPSAGVISEIIHPSGSTLGSEELIAKIDTEAKAASAPSVAAVSSTTSPEVVATEPQASATTVDKSNVASPAASKILSEKNIAVTDVAGSGKDGRVTKADALSATPKATSSVIAPAVNIQGTRPEQRVPMTRLRARIAERLLQSQADNALLTTFNEVNMQPLLDLRKQHQEQFTKTHGIKLGIMSFFVKAAVHALKKFPIINASVDGTDIIYHGYFDIGVAVSSPRGLVVPIIRDADQLSFADIEKTIVNFAEKARDGKLTIDEMTGGTFTISNGGTFGSMLSTPIINPPQSAILGVHATKDRAVVENGQIVIRPMNYLAMTYDHRIIDGREAVLSLVAMKDALEDPSRILFEI